MKRTSALTLFTIGFMLAVGRVLVGCTPLPTPAQRVPTTASPPAPHDHTTPGGAK